MTVRDRHGVEQGHVERCEARTFVVARGFPFEKRFPVRYEGVVEVRDDEVWMDEAGSQLEAEAYATPLEKEQRSET
jgi:hypothetical protein